MSKVFSVAIISKWYNEKVNNSGYERCKALREKIRTSLKKTVKLAKDFDVEVRNVRASAGRSVFDSIYSRIKCADIIIVDISDCKNDLRNIWLELGIALALSKERGIDNVYLISSDTEDLQGKEIDSLINLLPSDLKGSFLSGYTFSQKKGITFNDGTSFLMSLHSDLRAWLRNEKIFEVAIDDESLEKDLINEK